MSGEGLLHRQVYDALRAKILAGELLPGARLPSTRALALDNGISRMTAELAYEQLAAEGYVETRRGSGTYAAAGIEPSRPARAREAPALGRTAAFAARVAGTMPLLSSRGHGRPRPRWDFRHGLPNLAEFPHARWRRLVGRHARSVNTAAYDYPPAAGSPRLRDAIAAYLRRSRGLACDPAQIVVVNGSQQGLDLSARLLLDPGDRALVEEPGYEGAVSALRIAGAKLVPVPVDGEGMNLAAAPAAARRARLAYVTPSHQYPLGGVLSLPRRLRLLTWARRAHAYVLEDDYDGEFRFDGRPLAPLKTLGGGDRVIFLGTFSKVMFPGLRLGYLVLPEPLVSVFARAKPLADGGTSALEQEALADFIASGSFERHVRRARLRYRERRATVLDAVAAHLGDRVEIVGANTGLHLVMRLVGWTLARGETLVRRARECDVGVYSVAPYYLTPPREAALILGYAGLTSDDIREGIRRLAALIDERR